MKKIIIALMMIMGIFLMVIGVFLSHENHNIDNKSNKSKLIRENQIKRYKKESINKGLYKYIQIFVVSNGVDTKYFANSDKEILFSQTFFWSDEENKRINVKSFNKRSNIVRYIWSFNNSY